MLDLDKPIVTIDGRPASILSRDVPGDKPFLVSFEHEMTGELTSGTFSRLQLQDSFKNEVVPVTHYWAVSVQDGIPVMVPVASCAAVLEGVPVVSVTLLGDQLTSVAQLMGTAADGSMETDDHDHYTAEGLDVAAAQVASGWSKIDGGLEDGAIQETGLLGVPSGEHSLVQGDEQTAMQAIDAIVRTPSSDVVAHDDVW